MTIESIQQQIKKAYDCVIIGAGNGGLAAAARLAAAGRQVLLLEQHNLPGGFATSFRRGRFEFEASLHQLIDVGSATDKGGVREFFENDLGVYLDWVALPEAFRLITTDPGEELDITIPCGMQAFVDATEEAVPGSKEAVTKYIELCKDVVDGLVYVGKSRGKPNKRILMTKHANFLKTTAYTVDQVADALKIPKEARKILHAQWCYLGLPTDRASFTLFAAMMYKLLLYGARIPKQRSHEIALSLEARIREMGSDVQYNTRVEEILTQNSRVVGLVTSKGDRIEARHVIANVSPTLVYNNLISPRSAVPAKAFQECNARVYGLSGFVVYLGLNASPDELGLREYSYFIYDNMNTATSYESFKKLDRPKIQASVCLNNAIPDCSPRGTSIVTLTTLFRPEAWQNVSPRDYVDIKNKIATDMIVEFEKATGTSIREHIEEIEVATPQTFARYTGSYNGIIYGYEPEPWDSLLPRMMMMQEDQYFGGLHFCGGFSFRCLGYSSSLMSGQTTALLTLRDLKEEIKP